jgi:hypothetical protein
MSEDYTITESWLCIDCGINTAPGVPDGTEIRRQLEASGLSDMHTTAEAITALQLDDPWSIFDDRSEVYMVRDAVWARAGMEPWGGCLCIACLERRLGRKLKPKDFSRDDPINWLRGSERLLKRRKYWHGPANS